MAPKDDHTLVAQSLHIHLFILLSCRFAMSEITSLNEMMKTYLKDWHSSINMACKGSIFIYIQV